VGSILGDASYALYTIHYPILLILVALAGGWAPIHKLWAQVAIIAGIFALAAVLARVDEMVRRSNVWARWPSLIWLRSTSEPA
jgi:peptidoglycan/LPS O-acetylase OafA/YrhL